MNYFDKAEVIVEWTTASELETVGFNLLRSEAKEGPFEQINANLVPAGSDALTGGDYTFTYSSVQAGITYFYMLEEIELTGETSRHGPIVVKARNTAKLELLIGFGLVVGAIIYAVILARDRNLENSSQQNACIRYPPLKNYSSFVWGLRILH
jgi:hypothetical protein